MWGLSKVPGLNYISEKVDDALPFGQVGDSTKSERYINAEKVVNSESKHKHGCWTWPQR